MSVRVFITLNGPVCSRGSFASMVGLSQNQADANVGRASTRKRLKEFVMPSDVVLSSIEVIRNETVADETNWDCEFAKNLVNGFPTARPCQLPCWFYVPSRNTQFDLPGEVLGQSGTAESGLQHIVTPEQKLSNTQNGGAKPLGYCGLGRQRTACDSWAFRRIEVKGTGQPNAHWRLKTQATWKRVHLPQICNVSRFWRQGCESWPNWLHKHFKWGLRGETHKNVKKILAELATQILGSVSIFWTELIKTVDATERQTIQECQKVTPDNRNSRQWWFSTIECSIRQILFEREKHQCWQFLPMMTGAQQFSPKVSCSFDKTHQKSKRVHHVFFKGSFSVTKASQRQSILFSVVGHFGCCLHANCLLFDVKTWKISFVSNFIC